MNDVRKLLIGVSKACFPGSGSIYLYPFAFLNVLSLPNKREREMIFSITDLHSFTAATPRSPVMFMWGAVLLHPERMCPILNKTCWICWDLHKRNKNKWKNSRKPFVIQATKGIGKSKIPNISFILCSCISGCCNIPVATWILKFTL